MTLIIRDLFDRPHMDPIVPGDAHYHRDGVVVVVINVPDQWPSDGGVHGRWFPLYHGPKDQFQRRRCANIVRADFHKLTIMAQFGEFRDVQIAARLKKDLSGALHTTIIVVDSAMGAHGNDVGFD